MGMKMNRWASLALTAVVCLIAEGALVAAVAQVDEILTTFAALLRIAQIESGNRRTVFALVNLSDVFAIVDIPAARWMIARARPRLRVIACNTSRHLESRLLSDGLPRSVSAERFRQ